MRGGGDSERSSRIVMGRGSNDCSPSAKVYVLARHRGMTVVSKFCCKQSLEFRIKEACLGGSRRWRRDQRNFVTLPFRLTYYSRDYTSRDIKPLNYVESTSLDNGRSNLEAIWPIAFWDYGTQLEFCICHHAHDSMICLSRVDYSQQN